MAFQLNRIMIWWENGKKKTPGFFGGPWCQKKTCRSFLCSVPLNRDFVEDGYLHGERNHVFSGHWTVLSRSEDHPLQHNISAQARSSCWPDGSGSAKQLSIPYIRSHNIKIPTFGDQEMLENCASKVSRWLQFSWAYSRFSSEDSSKHASSDHCKACAPGDLRWFTTWAVGSVCRAGPPRNRWFLIYFLPLNSSLDCSQIWIHSLYLLNSANVDCRWGTKSYKWGTCVKTVRIILFQLKWQLDPMFPCSLIATYLPFLRLWKFHWTSCPSSTVCKTGPFTPALKPLWESLPTAGSDARWGDVPPKLKIFGTEFT